MNIKIKLIHPLAKAPTYATDGSGCFDLYAIDDGSPALIYPVVIDTGLQVEVPEDHVMLIFSRSGHGFHHDVRLSNCVGVIDADYRGSIKVKLAADQSRNLLYIKPGDRVAQALVVHAPRCSFSLVHELSETARGDGGFGSTGQ